MGSITIAGTDPESRGDAAARGGASRIPSHAATLQRLSNRTEVMGGGQHRLTNPTTS